MKILLSFPGHLKTVPMNGFIYQTLKAMGHEVVPFNFGVQGIYQRLIKKISNDNFLNHINNKLKRLADIFKPDIFLTIFGFDHNRETVDYIKKKDVITICWWLNDPFQFNRSVKQAGFYDYYFTNAKGSVEGYRESGIKNVFFLPVGCYPPVHRRLADAKDKKYDICFAGDWHPVREEMLSSLAADFNISIFGPWGDKMKRGYPLKQSIKKDGGFSPDEMVRVFNQSKIVLNIHTWFGKWDYGINPRVFEANGCGAFQICDYKKEIVEMYDIDSEIVLYRNIDELKTKLSHFLCSDRERDEIAGNALLKTHNRHTYKERLKEMFSICGMKDYA
ncbi:MAG: glycosyltransferase [Deltaproteobacteria bacterium]|nr:glycosyltransferase [Deltaproteobacteria bacterium]